MFLVDTLILVTGLLVLLGIASSKFSARFGVPVLVLFMFLGMLAGSEGVGRIEFENYTLAHGIGTVALVMILFSGGLSTRWSSIQATWKPSLVLATVGVLVTTFITGLAASWILQISLLEGLLLGSIIGSTDAAAVFSILRSGGVRLPDRLSATLEIESGSNDPMAVFLTVSCIEILSGRMSPGLEILGLFLQQMAVGGLVALIVGFAAVRLVNAIGLESAGLYPVLVTALALLTFGIAAWLGGSGFLAVYLAGIVIGNNRLVFQRGILQFHDAAAWLSQIVMFVVLGMLSNPSRLVTVAWPAILIGTVLVLVARPIAVLLSVWPFRFDWRELTFLSWVGLKGAVPITLSTFPLMFHIERAPLIFDVVFFVVILSAAIQGWTLPAVARRLGLEAPPEPQAPMTLEISSLRHVDGDIVDYAVAADSRAAGRCVKDLALPEGVLIAVLAREHQMIPPHGHTQVLAGDHVILIMRPGTRVLVDRVFAHSVSIPVELPEELEFPLRGSTTVGELQQLYDIPMDAPASFTLDEAVRRQLEGHELLVGRSARFGPIMLYVRELAPDGRIQRVGMAILRETVGEGNETERGDVATPRTESPPADIG